MGILLETENNYLSTILDIVLIFILGFVLLLFAYTMKSDNRFVMLYVALIVVAVILYNTIYIHNHINNNKKKENMYNVLTFLNIYLMILMVLLSAMSLYITMDDNKV
jgi:heme O synthase-like polyprenyltransferase